MFSNYTFLNSNFYKKIEFFFLFFSNFLFENRKLCLKLFLNFFNILYIYIYIFIRILNFTFQKPYPTPQI